MSDNALTNARLTDLHVGETFTYRGRTLTLSDYSGWTWGDDGKGEYARFKVWNEKGRETWLTVRTAGLS